MASTRTVPCPLDCMYRLRGTVLPGGGLLLRIWTWMVEMTSSSSRSFPDSRKPSSGSNLLVLEWGRLQFRRVSYYVNLDHQAPWRGLSVGDIDRDGDPDFPWYLPWESAPVLFSMGFPPKGAEW